MSFNRGMDKEDVMTYTMEYYSAIKKGGNLTIYIDVGGTGEYYDKRNKSIRERQLSYGFIRMWNIRNSTEDIRGKKGKLKGGVNRRWNEP